MKIRNALILGLLIFIYGCGGNADNLKINDMAPDFSLSDADGEEYTLSSYRGESPVVIYFYPKAGTPGCTDQACGIRDEYQKFEENNIVVLGISVDTPEAIEEFENKYGLNFPLLSDQEKVVSKKYDVLNDLGFSNRITFIVNKEGRIVEIMRDVNVETHADDVFAIASEYK